MRILQSSTVFLFGALVAVLLLSRCSDDQIFNRLSVEKGQGSGIYPAGQLVAIQADTPAAGFGFYRWEGDTEWIADAAAPITTLSMPLEDANIRAVYKELPTYVLQVTGGSGSGRYLAGTQVSISAILPPGDWVFDYWEGDVVFLANANAANTLLTMPDRDVAVTAVFEEADLVSFQYDVMPIMQQHCISCHGPSNNKPYTNYNEISTYAADIKTSLETGYMPPNGMPQFQKEVIYKWIAEGKRNN